MIPIKAKSLIPKVAQETGFSEAVVERLITFYYNLVKDKLTQLEFTSLLLEGFGKFYIKVRSLENVERTANKRIELFQEKQTPKVETMARGAQEDLIKIKHIQKLLGDIKQKKEFIKLHKQTYKDDKVRKSLEGQVGNIEGLD